LTVGPQQAEIREAHPRHNIAALMGLEGCHPREDDLRLPRVFMTKASAT
jgi:microsomal dipeptidase-like Zn-dependent dipeptidase